MNHQNADEPTCPFCPFSDPDSNFVLEHVQFCHPENGAEKAPSSTLSATERQVTSLIGDSAEGPRESIHWSYGHQINLQDLNKRFDLCPAEIDGSDNEFPLQPGSQNYLPDETTTQEFPLLKHRFSKQDSASSAFSRKDTVYCSASTIPVTGVIGGTGNIKRLGRTELGPYAHEKQMPAWLRSVLEKGAKTTKLNQITTDGKCQTQETTDNEAVNVIPALARLCGQDKTVQRAFLCSPGVHHISKMPREGGFCGYRNIQMLISYIQETRGLGHDHFPELPTILQLQDMIEQAWDMGFNSVARAETGGIRGTRKYIGTPEAHALFLSLGIPCEASSIGNTKEIPAHDALLTHIATYFKPTLSTEKEAKVVQTNMPPLYFQHHGHSLTIIGFEIRDHGKANLLVLDPMYKTPSALKRLGGARAVASDPTRLLKAYRRGVPYLQKYKTFEILKLSLPNVKHEN